MGVELVLGSPDYLVSATCPSGLTVGDFVYASGPAAGDVLTVDKADILNGAKMPSLGVVIEKPTATTARVMLLGLYTPGVVLALNKVAYVGANSRLTTTMPLGNVYVQRVGMTIDQGRVFLNPSPLLVKLLA